MRRDGIDVISLSAGAPDFAPPPWALEAARRALETGRTGYTSVDGTVELKQVIATKFEQENGLRCTPDQVLVSNGAKHSIYNAIAVLCDSDSEVLMSAPYWVSYPAMVRLCGAEPIIVPTTVDDNFKITAAQVRENLSLRTRLLILNSPGNPSGQVYTAEEYTAIARVLAEHPSVMVLCDDIYEHVYWGDDAYQTFAQVAPELAQRTITVNGLSKAFAMTGFRIGYCAADPQVIGAMRTFQGQTAGCPNSIAQEAAIAALERSQEFVCNLGQKFQKRHQAVFDTLRQLPGIRLAPAQGAFYAFVDCTEAMARKGLADDATLAEALLTQAHVAAVPGSAFGVDGHMRFSFATSDDLINRAMDRITDFFRR